MVVLNLVCGVEENGRRVECEERLGGNLIGKGGGRIEWGETRSAPVAERV